MAKEARGHSIPLLSEPGERSGQPRYLRLYRRIREGVLAGAIPPGTRLPSARTLAREEGISRNTVEAALSQLQAEGFVVRRVGSGSWISDRIPDRLLRPMRFRQSDGRAARRDDRRVAAGQPPPGARRLSARGVELTVDLADSGAEEGLLFAPCVPALDALPLDSWKRIAARVARRASGPLLVPPPVAGLPELRAAVAAYLSMSRGVRCTADRVVIVNSTQQALDLVSRLLLDAGDTMWFEDPGYRAARCAFAAAGARLVPVPVDAEGIDVAAGVARAPDARLAYVTPSHQYPLGVTLSLARRLALLEWAERSGGWIVEDDYDSELRYDGRPHASMQGIDDGERVIYAGTFNKILFPTLRIAYLVLPPALVTPFARARQLVDGFPPSLTQRVLAEFIHDGYLSIHLRRVRTLYQQRRALFLSAAERYLAGVAQPGGADAGMHVTLHLPAGTDDTAISAAAQRRGLALPALSTYFLGPAASGLVVHYGHVPDSEIERGTRRLAGILAGT